MKLAKYLSMGLLSALLVFGGLASHAEAAHLVRVAHSSRPHFKVKKNQGPFGGKYMAPKKQHRPTGRYRSPVTGQVLYGKPVKH